MLFRCSPSVIFPLFYTSLPYILSNSKPTVFFCLFSTVLKKGSLLKTNNFSFHRYCLTCEVFLVFCRLFWFPSSPVFFIFQLVGKVILWQGTERGYLSLETMPPKNNLESSVFLYFYSMGNYFLSEVFQFYFISADWLFPPTQQGNDFHVSANLHIDIIFFRLLSFAHDAKSVLAVETSIFRIHTKRTEYPIK